MIVAIENKVKATQSMDQLNRYRGRVESAYKNASHRLYIFLTRHEEEPEDDTWAAATYQQVHDILQDCLNEQRSVIGNEPRVLLDHYLQLLKESFMENTEIANLARKIYQKHSLALDAILKFRPDSLQLLTDAIAQRIKGEAEALKLVPLLTSKGYVRFIPKIWDTALNRQGTAWGNEKSAYIIVEIVLWGRIPVLKIIAGHSPEKWSDELWEMSFKEPFKGQKRKKKPTKYMAVYVVKNNKHPLEDLEAQPVDDLADEIWKWCKAELINEDFKKCLTIIKDHIQKLPQKT
jgi:PD-(D/E)XK nuclease superfamily